MCLRGALKHTLDTHRKHSTIMTELVSQIAAAYEEFQKDAAAQANSGNKAAGTRARKASLNIEKLMKQFRKASLEAAK